MPQFEHQDWHKAVFFQSLFRHRPKSLNDRKKLSQFSRNVWKYRLVQWCPTFFVPRSTLHVATLMRSTSPMSTSHTHSHCFQPAVGNFTTLSCFKYVLSTMGVSKESISKFLIGNRFHVKLRILSPENCKQSLQVKS